MAYAGPTYVGKSTAAGGVAGVNIDFTSSGRTSGDLLVIAVETANEAISAPSGFTQVPTVSPQGQGTAASSGGVRLTLFEKISDGTETTVSIGDSGDHQYAVGGVFRGTAGSIAIEASAGNVEALSGSGTFGGVTTSVGNCLIAHFVATNNDQTGASWSAQANANLTSVTERHDAGTADGQGGGIMLVTGEKETAGAPGNTTATQSNTRAYCWITLALKNGSTGGTAIDVGRADETDTAQGLILVQQRTLGRAEESDTALGLSAVQQRAVGRADEADTALGLAVSQARSIGLTEEIDTAFGLDLVQVRAVGRADETDFALGLSQGGTAISVGLASETDTALGLELVQYRGVGTAIETDAAFGLVGSQVRSVGGAEEIDASLGLSASQARAVGRADESDEAFGLVSIQVGAVGLAEETDAALGLLPGDYVPPPVPTSRQARTGLRNFLARGVTGTRHAITIEGRRAA